VRAAQHDREHIGRAGLRGERVERASEALSLASRRIDGDALWLLSQETTPAPDALLRLVGALETSPLTPSAPDSPAIWARVRSVACAPHSTIVSTSAGRVCA
jgi:hypothetical protein